MGNTIAYGIKRRKKVTGKVANNVHYAQWSIPHNKTGTFVRELFANAGTGLSQSTEEKQ